MATTATIISYVLTGSSAQMRFGPVLEQHGDLGPDVVFQDALLDSSSPTSAAPVDLLWMNTSTTAHAHLKATAICYNHLSGTAVLEDKCKLAIIQSAQTRGKVLRSFVVQGSVGVAEWVAEQNESSSATTNLLADHKIWVVKDGLSNGASGLWLLNARNAQEIISTALSTSHEYVLQEYIQRPLLWNDRKFHFRCYAILTGDLRLHVYRHAFLHAANEPYTCAEDGSLPDDVHITNCCANKEGDKFAGEIVVDLPVDYPSLWPGIKQVLAGTIEAASGFMANQRSKEHFEFIGFDVMADEAGEVWVIEANCPPGMDSATGLEHAEFFHHQMAVSLMRTFVLAPVLQEHARRRGVGKNSGEDVGVVGQTEEEEGAGTDADARDDAGAVAATDAAAVAVTFDTADVAATDGAADGGSAVEWVAVSEPCDDVNISNDKAGLGRNALRFALFQRRIRKKQQALK